MEAWKVRVLRRWWVCRGLVFIAGAMLEYCSDTSYLYGWISRYYESLHSPPFNEPLSSSSVVTGTMSTASLFGRLYVVYKPFNL